MITLCTSKYSQLHYDIDSNWRSLAAPQSARNPGDLEFWFNTESVGKSHYR